MCPSLLRGAEVKGAIARAVYLSEFLGGRTFGEESFNATDGDGIYLKLLTEAMQGRWLGNPKCSKHKRGRSAIFH